LRPVSSSASGAAASRFPRRRRPERRCASQDTRAGRAYCRIETFIGVYLGIGFLVAFGLLGWLMVSSVRRHGFRSTVRGAVRVYLEELPLNWRVPVAAWMFLIALPLIAAWSILADEFDEVGAIFVTLLWLLYFALLRWHRRAKARARSVPRPPRRRHAG
jgi:hypothetical protein